jgi:hypothetical protein
VGDQRVDLFLGEQGEDLRQIFTQRLGILAV